MRSAWVLRPIKILELLREFSGYWGHCWELSSVGCVWISGKLFISVLMHWKNVKNTYQESFYAQYSIFKVFLCLLWGPYPKLSLSLTLTSPSHYHMNYTRIYVVSHTVIWLIALNIIIISAHSSPSSSYNVWVYHIRYR